MRSLIVRVEGRQPGPPREDLLAVEEPLEIQLGYERKGWRVHKSVSVTMRTPGADRELAAGFLFTEGILTDAAQIDEIRPSADDENVVRVELRAGVPVDLRRLERHFYTASSCGVCGKASIAALNLSTRQSRPAAGPVFDAAVVHAIPAALRAAQSVFDQTGGLHAAALFDAAGRLDGLREDVGRHNAVDKLIGAQLLAGKPLPLAGRGLFVSGARFLRVGAKSPRRRASLAGGGRRAVEPRGGTRSDARHDPARLRAQRTFQHLRGRKPHPRGRRWRFPGTPLLPPLST